MREQINLSTFKSRAYLIHGDKYNYEKVVYENILSKISIECNKCFNIFKQTPNDHLNGRRGCPLCVNNIKYTNDNFIEKSIQIYGERFDYKEVDYVNAKTKILLKCNECDDVFNITPNNHFNGKVGCKCSKNKRKSLKSFVDLSIKIHGDKYNYDDVNYITNRIKVKIKCNCCNDVFYQTPYKHIYNMRGCKCETSSMGEKIIKEYLSENSYIFKEEHTFPNCKNEQLLRFDFFIPCKNICIEYDGIQHFEEVEFFGGKKALEKQQKKDSIKINFCKDNNIKLIKIPYYNIKYIYDILKREM